jgi:hypothetical protein
MICKKSIFVVVYPIEIVDQTKPQTFYSFVLGRICSKGFANHIKIGGKIN